MRTKDMANTGVRLQKICWIEQEDGKKKNQRRIDGDFRNNVEINRIFFTKALKYNRRRKQI